jgi:PelA/Pel-15E family pectate lyase
MKKIVSLILAAALAFGIMTAVPVTGAGEMSSYTYPGVGFWNRHDVWHVGERAYGINNAITPDYLASSELFTEITVNLSNVNIRALPGQEAFILLGFEFSNGQRAALAFQVSTQNTFTNFGFGVFEHNQGGIWRGGDFGLIGGNRLTGFSGLRAAVADPIDGVNDFTVNVRLDNAAKMAYATLTANGAGPWAAEREIHPNLHNVPGSVAAQPGTLEYTWDMFYITSMTVAVNNDVFVEFDWAIKAKAADGTVTNYPGEEPFDPNVDTTPRIEMRSQPRDLVVRAGAITSMDRIFVEARSQFAGTLRTQWYVAETRTGEGTPIAGASSTSFAIPADAASGIYYYYAVLSVPNEAVADTVTDRAMVVVSPAVASGQAMRRTILRAGSATVLVNGAEAAGEFNAPISQNGVLLVPINTVDLDMDITVGGDTVTAKNGNLEAVMNIGSTYMTLSSGGARDTLPLPAAPIRQGGVVYIPLQAVAGILGAGSIGWEPIEGVMVVVTGAHVSTAIVLQGGANNMNNQPEAWYGSAESIRIAENQLLWQRNSGGWPSDTNFATVLTDAERAQISAQKGAADASLDNGAMHQEMRYLARMYEATRIERYRDAYTAAIEAILRAQQPNGGIPQSIEPPPPGATHYRYGATFNDNAMTNVMNLWSEILRGTNANVRFYGVDDALRERIRASWDNGIEYMLNSQVWSPMHGGMVTSWAAQYVPFTTEPGWGRVFEPPSISGDEAIRVVRFLMGLDPVRDGLDAETWARVQDAVHNSIRFFALSEMTGYRAFTVDGDRRIERTANPATGNLWGRFIHIETFLPVFVDRQGQHDTVGRHLRAYDADNRELTRDIGQLANYADRYDIVNSYMNLSPDRRNEYGYLRTSADGLMRTDYPAWLARNNLTHVAIGVVEVRNHNIPKSMPQGGTIDLSGGFSFPLRATAPRGIIWSVTDAGTTGAALANNRITAPNAGVMVIRATVADGTAPGVDFTADFLVEVIEGTAMPTAEPTTEAAPQATPEPSAEPTADSPPGNNILLYIVLGLSGVSIITGGIILFRKRLG